MSYSASTGAVTLASKSVAATGVVVGWFLVLLLVTGGLVGETFFGAAAAVAAGGTGLGLAILAGLPTCAFRGTLACGGVTAEGPRWCRYCLGWSGGYSASPYLHLLWAGLDIQLLSSLFQLSLRDLLFSF